ncbi:hypothetical protein W03_12170 [Nitrosomonas sp. PY1]|uniref:transposase n=1 Tax=Nitrosomonas sp. PY1 TaxID=1803906 RepID=UPI001FC7CC69|nr:transposase [Nitrosomonas sp. PY1]GKS69213.1 hypothetical protein W03_12170 [Nitrosomonas sp. PY1]
MSEYIHKWDNVTTLLYHLLFPAKYRRAVFDDAVDKTLRDVCLELEKRYQLKFLEIGTDEDHVHFLVQSVSYFASTVGRHGDEHTIRNYVKGQGKEYQKLHEV